MANETYLVSPNHTGKIHLAVWANDRSDGTWPTGRSVPICGRDRGVRWDVTGPWAEKWPTYSRYELCSRCRHILEMLTDEAQRLSGGASHGE